MWQLLKALPQHVSIVPGRICEEVEDERLNGDGGDYIHPEVVNAILLDFRELCISGSQVDCPDEQWMTPREWVEEEPLEENWLNEELGIDTWGDVRRAIAEEETQARQKVKAKYECAHCGQWGHIDETCWMAHPELMPHVVRDKRARRAARRRRGRAKEDSELIVEPGYWHPGSNGCQQAPLCTSQTSKLTGCFTCERLERKIGDLDGWNKRFPTEVGYWS